MTRRAEKLLAAMRRSPASGWKWRDLDRLYSHRGFVRREGGKHTVYTHPKHTHLQATVSRKRTLAVGYITTAIRLIDAVHSADTEAE